MLIFQLPYNLKRQAYTILNIIQNNGGTAFWVGGVVRDSFLGISSKDLDIEVFGISLSKLKCLLQKFFKIILIGKSFGILKIQNASIDICFPRTEIKNGTQHKSFKIIIDENLTFKESAIRRDFTINTIGWNPYKKEIKNPFNGIHDIKYKILKATSKKFLEDSLRVLRAMQFIARFDFKITDNTLLYCIKKIKLEKLSIDRVKEEWKKLIFYGDPPSLGLNFLKKICWIHYFKSLCSILGCPQDPIWHPEGDVWEHTLYALDTFSTQKLFFINKENLLIGLSIICHDLGKPQTTFQNKIGRLVSPKHEYLGLNKAKLFLLNTINEKWILDKVLILIYNHLKPFELFKSNVSIQTIKRLIIKIDRIDRLLRICNADDGGRPPKKKYIFIKIKNWINAKLYNYSLQDIKPNPIIRGRHLLKYLGIKSSPLFKKILDNCYQLQINESFNSLKMGIRLLYKNVDILNLVLFI